MLSQDLKKTGKKYLSEATATPACVGITMRCFESLLLILAIPVSLAWSSLSSSVADLKRQQPHNRSLFRSSSSSSAFSLRPRSCKHGIMAENGRNSADIPRGGNGKDDKEKDFDRIRRQRISVGIILVSSFLNLLGFTMAGPITPALGQHFGLEPGVRFGSLTSAYPLGMLLGLFLWPSLSDRIGRKPVIALSLFGSGLGLTAQACVVKANFGLNIFLASRVLTGSFAGSSPVSKAYLADVGYQTGKLPRYLALRDAFSTMAFIIGPVLGGVMYDIRRRILGLSSDIATKEILATTGSLSFVIGVSAVASLAAALVVALLVQEEKGGDVSENSKKISQPNTISKDENGITSCPLGTRLWAGVASVCLISFLFNVGDSTFHAFFPALLRDRVGLDARSIGLSYTVLACVSFFMSATLAGGLLKKFGPVATCAAGLTTLGSGLLALGACCRGTMLIPHSLALAAAALYYCGVPLYGPTIPTMLLQCVSPNRRGAVMGLDGAINTVGRVIAPLGMGELYRRFGSVVAFSVAGSGIMVAAVITVFRRWVVLRANNRYRQIVPKTIDLQQ